MSVPRATSPARGDPRRAGTSATRTLTSGSSWFIRNKLRVSGDHDRELRATATGVWTSPCGKQNCSHLLGGNAGSVDHRPWSESGCTCVLLTSSKDEILL